MSEAGPPVAKRRWRWGRWLAVLAAVLLVLAGGGVALVDTSVGHRLIADQIAAQRPANGLRFSVGRITGSVWSKATLLDVRVSDLQGPVLAVPRAELDWRPLAWLGNQLDINSLDIPTATLIKAPTLNPGKKRGPILPGFDIRMGRLTIDKLMLAPRVTGVTRIGRIVASGDVRNRRALVKLAARVEGSDDLKLMLDAAPDSDRFDLDLRASGAAHGLLAKLSGIGKPLTLAVAGEGRWARWRGTAKGQVAGVNALDLALGNDSGRYTLAGTLGLDTIAGAKAARLFAPQVTVHGAGTLVDRVLSGTLALRSRALAV
ncbi:MAG: translocation/assembly module TamB, partial [Sphingomonas sp.]|nr:translocation/assembly module TamB [Sphingomonas sp.]